MRSKEKLRIFTEGRHDAVPIGSTSPATPKGMGFTMLTDASRERFRRTAPSPDIRRRPGFRHQGREARLFDRTAKTTRELPR
jgi:hypothetical protein